MKFLEKVNRIHQKKKYFLETISKQCGDEVRNAIDKLTSKLLLMKPGDIIKQDASNLSTITDDVPKILSKEKE